MEAADPPAGGAGGGGGGAAADGVAPHVAAGLAAAAAAPGEQAPAPLGLAALEGGQLDGDQPGPVEEDLLGGLDGDEDDEDDEDDEENQVQVAVEDLLVEVAQGPAQPVIQGGLPETAGQDEGAVEVAQGPPPPAIQGVLPEAAGQDEGAVEFPLFPPPPAIQGAHPQPQQGHVGGDDEEGYVNQNQGGLPEAQPQEIDWLLWVLAGITVLVLGAVMVAELGFNITTWATTLKGMTAKEWKVAVLLALGDMTSLGITYAPAWRFMALWQGEGGGAAAGIAALVPPVVALLNVTVWFCYGLAVDGMNASVSIINGTAMVFQSIYTFAFCVRSEEPPTRKFIVLLLGAGAGVLIAVVDVFILRDTFGIRIDDAISWSGACTSAASYGFAGLLNMVAAHVNLGADGMPRQGLASFANAAVWLAYATATDKLGMQIANGFGIILFVAQVGQLLFYRLWKPQQYEEGGEGIHEPLVRRTDEHV